MHHFYDLTLFYRSARRNKGSFIVMQEASDAPSKTADSDTVATYQVSSVQLVTDKKLEAFNKSFTSDTASQSTDRPSTKWI